MRLNTSKIILFDNDYYRLATNAFQKYTYTNIKDLFIWETIYIDFNYWIKKNWETIIGNIRIIIKKYYIS